MNIRIRVSAVSAGASLKSGAAYKETERGGFSPFLPPVKFLFGKERKRSVYLFGLEGFFALREAHAPECGQEEQPQSQPDDLPCFLRIIAHTITVATMATAAITMMISMGFMTSSR